MSQDLVQDFKCFRKQSKTAGLGHKHSTQPYIWLHLNHFIETVGDSAIIDSSKK